MLLTVPAFGSAITKSTTTTTARMIRFRRVSIVASYRAAGRHASSARPRTLLVDWFDDEEPVARLVDGSSDAFASGRQRLTRIRSPLLVRTSSPA